MARRSRGIRLGTKPNQSGAWEIHWTDRGRSFRRSTGTTDRRTAEKVLAQFILHRDEVRAAAVATTCGEVLTYYAAQRLDQIDGGDGKPPPKAAWRQRIAITHLRHYFEAIPVGEVGQVHFDAYLRHRLTAQIGRRASPPTVRRELSVLVAACHYAGKRRLLDRSTIPAGLDLPANNPPRMRWLTPDEQWRLVLAAGAGGRTSWGFLFVAIAMFTGARRAAICALTWKQVDLDRGIIDFLPPGSRQAGNKRRPPVPIAEALLPVLREAWASRSGDSVLGGARFRKRAWNRIVAAAGLPGVTPHVLRHTLATCALQRGVPIREVAGVLGDTVAMIERVYGHHSPDYLKGAVNWRARMTA